MKESELEEFINKKLETTTEAEKVIILEMYEKHKKLDEEDRERFRKRAEYYSNKFHLK